ncbi:MAG: hypothetical protein K0V04_28275 [Deltaproteobacteria bacterium]|nr:hypothetical protein [Deltaproteobacteria bacterium]
MVDLSCYTGVYPVTIDDAVEGLDGKLRRTTKKALALTPGTMGDYVDNLKAAVQTRFGAPTCLLSLAEAENDTNVEHVLLQGLGARWVKLPRGLVRASANNKASASEQQFLRTGLMGMLRPFYLGSKKEVSFDFSDGTTVTFMNHPGTGFEIGITEPAGAPLRDWGLPDQAGAGVLRLNIPVEIPEPRAPSTALHKLVYLTLCVVEPEVALDTALQPARDFILGGGDYRPYAETFVPRAAPGFQACFYVARRVESGAVARVQAVVRLHHVRYTLGLVGPDLVSRLPDVVPETLRGGKRNVSVEFDIESLQRMTTDESIGSER